MAFIFLFYLYHKKASVLESIYDLQPWCKVCSLQNTKLGFDSDKNNCSPGYLIIEDPEETRHIKLYHYNFKTI